MLEKVPMAHESEQTVSRAVLVEYIPLGHGMQLGAPEPVKNWPDGQLAQPVEARIDVNVPLLQKPHWVVLTTLVNLPGWQSEHVDAPDWLENVPMMHVLQPDDIMEELNVPASHQVQ